MLGYSCELAADGAEAVRMVKDLRFAAIIMDIKLIRVDGLEATRQIREVERETRVPRSLIIGITSGFCTRKQALQAGMAAIVHHSIRTGDTTVRHAAIRIAQTDMLRRRLQRFAN